MSLKPNRRQAIGILGACAFAGYARPVFAVAKKTYQLEPKPVADGIWMVEGATEYFSAENGGAIVNCALIETGSGLVVFDTGPSLKYGEALRKVAMEVTGRGIAATFNSHHHPDHFFGNQVFTDMPVYALPQTAYLARSEGDGLSDNMYRLLGDWMRGTEVTPPSHDITSSTLEIGGRKFQTLPLGGHTNSDLALLDLKTGTLLAGDLAFFDRAPTTPHANLEQWQQSIADLKSLNPGAILPGHGPFDRELKSLAQTSEYLAWLDTLLRNSANDGLDMMEVMDANIPEQFKGLGAMPDEFYRSVVHLFPQVEREIMPVVTTR